MFIEPIRENRIHVCMWTIAVTWSIPLHTYHTPPDSPGTQTQETHSTHTLHVQHHICTSALLLASYHKSYRLSCSKGLTSCTVSHLLSIYYSLGIVTPSVIDIIQDDIQLHPLAGCLLRIYMYRCPYIHVQCTCTGRAVCRVSPAVAVSSHSCGVYIPM